MVLHTLRRLEAHIDSAFLGPLLPETEEQRRLWTDPPIDFDRIPLVDRWTPPAFLPAFREEGFVLLGSNTVCFQRGYGPGEEMMNQYGRIISTCFQYRTPTECTSFVARSTYDFLVLVMAGPNQVAAGCTVEFHACAHQIPYLFVGDLCTDLPFRGNGYAHQLVHAVHTLGSLLAATAQTNAWKHAVPSDRPLYIGLTVDRKSSVADRLVRLYRECGLSTRDETPSLPIIDYGTFTPYSCFGWHVERRPEQEIGMWKCITPYTLYEDANGAILHPSSETFEPMYHAFPETMLECVLRHGIVHPHHAGLTPLHENTDVYVGGDECIAFFRGDTDRTTRFVICTRNAGKTFRPRISVSPWFALQIGAGC